MVDRPRWIDSSRLVPSRVIRPARRFTELQAASGIVLVAAAAVALIWANAFGESYATFWETRVQIGAGSIFEVDESLAEFVNTGLMALFFFVVGLEIKRALRLGELRDPKAAALPAVAAAGGMIIPALIYFALNPSGDAASGWGIPMATDIAFALGVIALLGPRIPAGARLFLLALALADDIGAILVIALFYTDDVSGGWLLISLGAYLVIYVAKHSQVRAMLFYWVAGVFVWYAMFKSGVHGTLAAVALGFLTPTTPLYSKSEFERRNRDLMSDSSGRQVNDEDGDDDVLALSGLARDAVSPLHRLSRALHPWTAFVVVPVFALANAGVRFSGMDLGNVPSSSVVLGVAFGLVAGKTAGIFLFSYAAVRFTAARLPDGVAWGHVGGLAVLGGTGFTVALFVTGLAFSDPVLVDLSKIGIFVGSLTAAVGGYALLRRPIG